MPRSALPQNYILKPGTLFESFETVADWTLSGSGGRTAVANTTQFLTGIQSLKCTVTGSIHVTKTISSQMGLSKIFRLGLYQHSSFATVNKIYLYFSTQTAKPILTGGSDKFFRAELRPQNLAQGVWSYWIMDRDTDFTCNASESWNDVMNTLQISILSETGEVSISLDELQIGMEYSPRLMIAFDDNRLSLYSEAYLYMTARGIKGTAFVVKNFVGAAGFATLANLQTMYAAGWAVGNHTTTHTSLATLTLAEQIAELSACTDYLIANGMPRAARHVAYPLGEYNNDTLSALAALGMITGRTSYNYQQYTPVNNPYLLNNGRTVVSTDSLATIKGYIDAAFSKGVSYQLIFHKLLATTDGTTTWWTPANFQALIDYIVARKIPCVTIDEWWKGLTNPRYQSVLLSRAEV